jgi:hypothetical protein
MVAIDGPRVHVHTRINREWPDEDDRDPENWSTTPPADTFEKVEASDSEDSDSDSSSEAKPTLESEFEDSPSVTLYATRVMIGLSKKNGMTSRSGGFGPKFDGNSILVETKPLHYTFIGVHVFQFETTSKIVSFESSVGNSDVAYPYAVTEDGRCLLLAEDVSIALGPYDTDPYRDYYDRREIVGRYDGILAVWVGRELCNFAYSPDPVERVNHWIYASSKVYRVICRLATAAISAGYAAASADDPEYLENLEAKLWGFRHHLETVSPGELGFEPKPMWIKRKGAPVAPLTVEEWVDINNRFGAEQGFAPIAMTRLLNGRLWMDAK